MAEVSKSKLFGSMLAAALAGSLLSTAGVNHIKKKEGVRYAAYPDPATGGKPWTICWGHTDNVYPGMTANREQCEAWLRYDLLKSEKVVKATVKVPLTQTEYDAYTSFVFNAGASNWKRSTMLRLLNQRQYRAACNQFPHWVYANKKVMNGLVTRRYEEQASCLKPSRIIYNGTEIR